MNDNERKQALIDRGVTIECPDSVSIDASINPLRIAPQTLIHSGCRLSGERTSIGPGTVLGEEAPVTLKHCQLGRDVRLKGGFFSGATFMDGVDFGSGAHVRPGTLLEEHASCGHTVGLKQTLLMPFVTLGSLINFCDCLMAGGRSKKDHGEVGSSYIHFNFTAHQDKATPSLMGDVSQGVMLDQPPIFLGGQGGLVGPTRLAYGTILAAGTLCRRDVLTPGKLVFGGTGHRIKEFPYDPRVFGEIDRICQNNFIYIGNLHALYAWYEHLRPILMSSERYAQACLEGARRQIEDGVAERITRLTQLSDKIAEYIACTEQSGQQARGGTFINQRKFVDHWPTMGPRLALAASDGQADGARRDAFLAAVQKSGDRGNYIHAVQSLPPAIRAQGAAWLQGIVDSIGSLWGEIRNG